MPLLPTRKDVKGAPAEMPRRDMCVSEYEMCDCALESIPSNFSNIYYGRKGARHFATNLDHLVKDLAKMEPEYLNNRQVVRASQKIAQASRNKDKASNKTQGNKPQGANRSASARTNGTRGNGPGQSSQSTNKLCKVCKKERPKIKHTHDTADCRYKGQSDCCGEVNDRQNGRANKRTYANESLGDNIRDVFAQMRKDQEKFLDRLDRRERDRREGRGRKSSRKSYGRGRDPDLSSDSNDSYSRGGRY